MQYQEINDKSECVEIIKRILALLLRLRLFIIRFRQTFTFGEFFKSEPKIITTCFGAPVKVA